MIDRRNFLKLLTASATLPLINKSIAADFSDFRNVSEMEQLKILSYKQRNDYEIQSGIITPKETNFSVRDFLPHETQYDSFWNSQRKLFLKRTGTGEKAYIVFHSNGEIVQEGYSAASYLLRDVRANQAVFMDLQLLNLLTAIQAWLNYFGHNDPISVNSGYRTKKSNDNLEGAAKNSMHLYGKAVDISFPSLKPNQVASIAKIFMAGGIGIYQNRNFLHLDTGRVRYWKG